MSSPDAANDDILALASQVQNFVPEAADHRPSFFLSLAPATSASYPRPKKPVISPVETAVPAAASEKTELSGVAAAAVSTAVEEPVIEKTEVKQRRSSSLSSSDSNKSGPMFRFLKLGPVHWGEHLDDHQQDWHEAVIE